MPTQRWKQVPVSCPSRRCILFCMTRSAALVAIWRKRLTRSPVSGRHRGREFGIAVREVVGLRDRVDRGPDDRMVDRLGDRLAHQVDVQISAPQALNVFGPRSDRISRNREALSAYGEFPDPSRVSPLPRSRSEMGASQIATS